MGYHIDNACLDAAHDATDFYVMARDVWDMRPFIPLNNTNEGNVKNLPMSTMTEDGVPICQAGHQMYYDGYCKDRDRLKWRCPIRAKKNQNLKCEHLDSCSSSSYGRVVHIQKTTHVYILLLPEEPTNGRTYMTTGHQQKGFSSEKRTTLSLPISRHAQRSVIFSMLY